MNNLQKSGKRKWVKVMAIVLPAILLIGGGYYWLVENQVHLQVTGGYTEFRYTLTNTSTSRIDKNITVITAINDGIGYVNLTIHFYGVSSEASYMDNLLVPLSIHINVHMPYNIIPSGFKIEAQETEKSKSTVDFDESFNEYMNVTPWPDEENMPGTWAPYTAYIGGTPHKSSFGMITHISWRIMDFMTLKTHTLKIRAEILGFSTPIVSAIVFVIDTSALVGDEK